MQQLCHHFDMNFGGSWGNGSLIPEENKTKYLISSLMEEAISSSQMEGAATTRKVAKEMLRKKMSPKDKSQQMILNNYNTILYITEHRDEPLSEELLLKIHLLMTEKALDNPEDAGQFRKNDDIVVGNALTGETVHTPPTTAKADIVGLLEMGILKEIAFNKVKKGYVKGDRFDEIVKGTSN